MAGTPRPERDDAPICRGIAGAVAPWAALALPGCGGGSAVGALDGGALVLSLVLVAVGGLGIGWLLAQQRRTGMLHDARQMARLARSLGGDLNWQTDAGHRLLPGELGGAGRLAWEVFDAGTAAGSLREALERQAPVDALPVTRAGEPGKAFELRAAPLFDSAGAFSGHLGLLRPVDAGGVADAALGALVDASAHPALVLARPPGSDRWQVLHASPAAQQHFGGAPHHGDTQLRDALPEPLRAAWDAGHAEAEGQGWHWRRLSVPPRELCVIWQDSGAPAAADEQAAFSYTVSHDLRAPIRVVEGFTRIVKEDYGDALDRVANDHLDRVLGAAARMNQMIDAMLTLARLSSQPLARQPVNLSQLAGYVIDDLRRQSPDRQAEIEIEPGLQVHGDPTLLRLVLENLLGNAWKYTGQRPQARIVFGREVIDGRSVFVVRDNGAGFDMRAADRLFGLFQRLHSATDFPGTGVGLASVRRIVQRHGGEIWADAEPGRGAAFHFTLRE